MQSTVRQIISASLTVFVTTYETPVSFMINTFCQAVVLVCQNKLGSHSSFYTFYQSNTISLWYRFETFFANDVFVPTTKKVFVLENLLPLSKALSKTKKEMIQSLMIPNLYVFT